MVFYSYKKCREILMAIYNIVPNSTSAAGPLPALTIAASMDQIL